MIEFLIKKVIILLLFIQIQNVYAQQSVKLLTFNVWQEGTSVSNGINKIRDVIVEVNPDIVCFTEVRNYKNKDWTTKIVNKLSSQGYVYERGYIGGDVSIISKFPIKSSELIYNGEGSIAKFNINVNGKPIVVGCAHLDYTNYACYLPRGYYGGSPSWNMIDDGDDNPKPITDIEELLLYNLNSSRDEQINAFLNSVKNEVNPIILMGDFNEPSHLDWTERTSEMFDHNGVVINWHSTYTLFENGFVDSFREYFPNEVLNPGITWPSKVHGKKSTSWIPKSDERDRIDFIFYKGYGVKTVYASLVGPKESYAFDKIVTSNTSRENFIGSQLDWPSDHKAVLVTIIID